MSVLANEPQFEELLRDLAIAWKHQGNYPADHPVRRDSLVRAHRRLRDLLQVHGPFVLGASRDGLVHENRKLSGTSAQRLGEALYERSVALLGFEEGLEAAELEVFLLRLGPDPRQAEHRALWEEIRAAGVRHIYLEPVDYSGVVLKEAGSAPQLEREPGPIWETIVRALVAGRRLEREGLDLATVNLGTPDEIAALLAELLGEEPGGAVDAGPGGPQAGGDAGAPGADGPGAGRAGGAEGSHAARVAPSALARLVAAVEVYLERAVGPARLAAARQLTELVRLVPPEARSAVVHSALRALSSSDTDGEALETMAAGLPPPTAVAALKRLAEEKVRLSARAVRLARELAAAAHTADAAPSTAYDELVAEWRGLFREEDIDRINPPDLPPLGDPLAIELPRIELEAGDRLPDLGERRDTLTEEFMARQLGRTLLEMLVHEAPGRASEPLLAQLEAHYRLFLASGRIGQATEIVETLRTLVTEERTSKEARVALRRSLDRLANRESIAALLEALPRLPAGSASSLRRLVDVLGSVAVRHLLSALSEEGERSRRHDLMSLLTALGPAVVADATYLLADSRWFVVRNMILLLRGVGDRSSLPQLRRCAEHSDLRVRLEAIKSLFLFDREVPAELLRRAIHDRDPKLAEAAVVLAGIFGIAQAVAPIVDVLRRRDLFGRRRSLRLKALRALAKLGNPSALPRLEHFFVLRWLAPVAREERRAAFACLRHYPEPARRPLVERGRRSRDPEIRGVCERLARGQLDALEVTHVGAL